MVCGASGPHYIKVKLKRRDMSLTNTVTSVSLFLPQSSGRWFDMEEDIQQAITTNYESKSTVPFYMSTNY